MILFPEVQTRARQELDRVVGHDRLPTFGDREDLPYLSAVVKEVLRWKPVAPLGEPPLSLTVFNALSDTEAARRTSLHHQGR